MEELILETIEQFRNPDDTYFMSFVIDPVQQELGDQFRKTEKTDARGDVNHSDTSNRGDR